MTARELYLAVLTEINKVGAASLLLSDFVYFANKAVQQYSNLSYSKYDIDQQSSDDLRVLTASERLPVCEFSEKVPGGLAKYYVQLPDDYVHLLNCTVIFDENDVPGNACGNQGDDELFVHAKRMTSENKSMIYKNAYFKPSYKNPYYYINTFNDRIPKIQTDGEISKEISTDFIPSGTVVDELIKQLRGEQDRPAEGRRANVSPVIMEIRCGKYKPSAVYIDYVKAHMKIDLTQYELDEVVDKSQVLEFPDYVCYEIANIVTRLVLENIGDTRLQTNIPINQSTASHQQQQTGK